MKFPYVQYEEMGVPVIPIEINVDKWNKICSVEDSYYSQQLNI